MRTYDPFINRQGYRSLEPYLDACRSAADLPFFGTHETFSQLKDRRVLRPGMTVRLVEEVDGEQRLGSAYTIDDDCNLLEVTEKGTGKRLEPEKVLGTVDRPQGWVVPDLLSVGF